MFEPQVYTSPISLSAKLVLSPAPIATTFCKFCTFVNSFVLLIPLSFCPSSPYKFEPVTYTSPVLLNATAWFFPAFISITPEIFFALITDILPV